jgi:hypothetical protein
MFPNKFGSPIIQTKFKLSSASRIFNSNSVSNLNLIPKVKLFLIIYSTRMQNLVNFGAI